MVGCRLRNVSTWLSIILPAYLCAARTARANVIAACANGIVKPSVGDASDAAPVGLNDPLLFKCKLLNCVCA